MGLIGTITGMKGASGFGSRSTAEEVTEGIDASNLTAIVTGGASGIGAETTRVLALRGAHVVIAARNLAQAAKVKSEVESKMPKAKLDCMELDLSSMASVRKFASEFKAANLPLNILINNAGVMMMPFQLSNDGIEMQFATNHIGHFLLTDLLLDKMKRTAKETGVEGRIVNLASAAHHFCYKGGINFNALNKKEEYSEIKAYGQSKLANVLHANELTRRLQVEGANITANSLHPGVIMTPLMRHTALFKMGFLKIFSGFLWKTVPQGAATTCYVALHPSLEGVSGCYFENCNVSKPAKLAKDTTLAQKLWDFSMDLTKSDSYAKSAS